MKQQKRHDDKPPSPRELQVDTARDDNPTCCRQPNSSNTNSAQGGRKTPKTPSTLHSPGAGGILRTMMLLRGARGGGQTNANSQTKPQSWRRRSAHHHRSNSLNSESSWTVPDNESISSSVAYDEDYDFLDTIESNASFSPPEPKPRTVEAPPAAEAVAPPAPPRLAKSPPQTTKHRKSHSHDFSYYPAPPTRARANSADGVGGVVLMTTTTTASPLVATPPRGRTGSNMSEISMTYSDEGDEDGDRVHRLVPWGGSPNRARTQSLEEFNASLAPQPARARTHSDFSTRSAPVAAASSATRKRGTLHDTTPTRRPSRSTPLAWTPPPPSHY